MRISRLICCSLVALAACGPDFSADNILVTGELRADGSCLLAVDGKPVTTPSRPGRARVDTMPEPPPSQRYVVRCSYVKQHDVGPPQETWFDIHLPRGHPLVGTYSFRPDTAAVRDTLPAFGKVQSDRWIDDGLIGAYLTPFDGWLVIERVDGARVVGRFRFHGRRSLYLPG